MKSRVLKREKVINSYSDYSLNTSYLRELIPFNPYITICYYVRIFEAFCHSIVFIQFSEGSLQRKTMSRFESRVQRLPVGDSTVGDPHFLSVEDPFVSLLLCPSLYTRDVGSCAWLSYAVSL